MNVVVIGGGAWCSASACLLRERGLEVTLVRRDPEQARSIAETGRNPRYLPDVRLDGVGATTLTPSATFSAAAASTS